MTIADIQKRSKAGLGRIPADYLIILILLLSVSAAFGLGLLAGRSMGQGWGGDDERLWIEKLSQEAAKAPAAAAAAPTPASALTVTDPAPAASVASSGAGKYVASRNGTKYYLPTCSGAKRIKEENKVWFETVEVAKAEGYTAAANCDGI